MLVCPTPRDPPMGCGCPHNRSKACIHPSRARIIKGEGRRDLVVACVGNRCFSNRKKPAHRLLRSATADHRFFSVDPGGFGAVPASVPITRGSAPARPGEVNQTTLASRDSFASSSCGRLLTQEWYSVGHDYTTAPLCWAACIRQHGGAGGG